MPCYAAKKTPQKQKEKPRLTVLLVTMSPTPQEALKNWIHVNLGFDGPEFFYSLIIFLKSERNFLPLNHFSVSINLKQ